MSRGDVLRRRGGVGLVCVVALGCGLFGTASASAAVIHVTTIGDDAMAGDGSVSLREAITAINTGNSPPNSDVTAQSPGTFGSGDTIDFNIPATGLQTIMVGNGSGLALPTMVKPVSIDGTSQPGYSSGGVPLIALNGSLAGAGANGFNFGTGSANSNVKAVAIGDFNGDGIADIVTAVSVQSNDVGVFPNGSAFSPAPNGGGIFINNANSFTIGGGSTLNGNVIGDNAGFGINVTGSGASGQIASNGIGVDENGNAYYNGGVGLQFGGGVTSGSVNVFGNQFGFNAANPAVVPGPIDLSFSAFYGVGPTIIAPGSDGATFPPGAFVPSGGGFQQQFSVTGGQPNQNYLAILDFFNCSGSLISAPLTNFASTVQAGANGNGSDYFTVPSMQSGSPLIFGGSTLGTTGLANPCIKPQPSPTPTPTPTPGPTINGVLYSPLGGSKSTFPERWDPKTGRFVAVVTNFNPVTNDDTLNTTLIGFDASPRAVLSKKKKHKKMDRYVLKPVTVTLGPGQHTTVQIPLTTAAKRYVASRTGKKITVDLVATVKDAAGQVNRFERKGQVKITKKKGKKH